MIGFLNRENSATEMRLNFRTDNREFTHAGNLLKVKNEKDSCAVVASFVFILNILTIEHEMMNESYRSLTLETRVHVQCLP